MYLYLEAPSETGGELSRFEAGFGDRKSLEVLADLWSQFAGLFGPPLAGQQPREPLLPELLLRLVNGRPGETEIRCGFCYGTAIGFQCPQRFVFELKQVLGIEKLRTLEGRMTDLGGTGVESAGGAQGVLFVLRRRRKRHCCNVNYAAFSRASAGCQCKYDFTE